MIEITLNTGLYFTGEHYFNDGSIINGVGIVGAFPYLSEMSLNGKILHETLPDVTIQGLMSFISNTGEFYISGSRLSIDTGFYQLPNDGNLSYEVINLSQRHFYSSEVHASLVTGFSGVSLGRLSGQHIFLNGQKLVSGENYIETNGNFIWIDPDVNQTGILFSFSKPKGLYRSGVYDVLTPFNQGGFSAYLNGLKLDDEDFIEIASILNEKIETGIAPKIKFDKSVIERTIFL